MRHIVITDTSSCAEIEAGMVALTEKVRRACIPSTAREIREDQDECVGLWIAAAEREAAGELDRAAS